MVGAALKYWHMTRLSDFSIKLYFLLTSRGTKFCCLWTLRLMLYLYKYINISKQGFQSSCPVVRTTRFYN